MIPEEEEEEEEQNVEEQPDPADQSTLVFNSDKEPFNTAVDTTSDDSAHTWNNLAVCVCGLCLSCRGCNCLWCTCCKWLFCTIIHLRWAAIIGC